MVIKKKVQKKAAKVTRKKVAKRVVKKAVKRVAKKSDGCKVTVTINGIRIVADKGMNIFELCKKEKIKIPHLCYHERLNAVGACRLCIVEVNGRIMTSCTTKVAEGQEILTHTARVLDARKTNLELLLANHDLNCTTCVKSLDCRLQRYAKNLMVNEIPYEGKRRHFEVDNSSVSIRRDNNKCILCERCVQVCNNVQTVYAIGIQKRGFESHIAPPFGKNLAESNCINCGQCVIACPTGALSEKADIQPVLDALNSNKTVVVQTAPSVRAALGECFGMPAGTPVTGKMVAALRKCGFDYVFDTNLGADITIMEEATEFLKRFEAQDNLPMITTCCPAWIKFGEQFFFDQLHHMSSCKSPQAIMSSLIKTYFAKKIRTKAEDIVVVDIMPCTAKKFEIQRPEFEGDADYVLTTVELAKLIKEMNIDFVDLEDEDFDKPLGESTGAGAIFGHTGGVMEAALRTVTDWVSGKDLPPLTYKKVRGMDTMREASLKVEGTDVKVACVHTLGEARKLMEQISQGTCEYHFIEIMACFGGCVGGGGQPQPCDRPTIMKRAKALNAVDSKKKVRKSHENKTAQKIYKDYLGKVGGKKAHKLLHTKYYPRDCL